MNIGLKNGSDRSVISFYDYNYDVLRTPDFKEDTHFLKPEHGLKYLGNPKHKTCRFCGKTEDEVSFNKIAHAFPEAIGNKRLATYYECDECNQFFGETIEGEYAKFFWLYHSIMMVSGKDGKRKCNYKISCDKRNENCAEYCIRIEINDKKPIISSCKEVTSDYISLKENNLIISKPVGNCCLIAVFKTLIKMAITVMPIEEIGVFSDTINWIRELEHKNYYANSPLLIRYRMIPGFNVTKYPRFVLFRRKKDVWDKPYMLFNLTYGCFSLLVEVPKNGDQKRGDGLGVKNIPFPEIPFITTEDGLWDMSALNTPKGMMHRIELSFEKRIDQPPNYLY